MSEEEKLDEIKQWLKNNEDKLPELVSKGTSLELIQHIDIPYKEVFIEELNKKMTGEDLTSSLLNMNPKVKEAYKNIIKQAKIE